MHELMTNVIEIGAIPCVGERVDDDDRVVRVACLGPVPNEVRSDETGAAGDENVHVRSGHAGRTRSPISARLGFVRSRSDSTGFVTPQSAAISGSSHATPSSSAAL